MHRTEPQVLFGEKQAPLYRQDKAGFASIDVAPDWRALYRTEAERIIFVDIGTHRELYG
jgi:mRNA-degrading endonuclease YafQ of YafQ-DinJ toxin-antitoxin module